MISKIGACRLMVNLPFALRPVEGQDMRKEIVVACVALTFRPNDPSNPQPVNPETVKESIKNLEIYDGNKVYSYLRKMCQRYDANAAWMNIRFGLNYKDKTYPCTMDFEYRKGSLRKFIANVVVQELGENKLPLRNGYIVDARVNCSEYIWFEDIIDTINRVLESRNKDDHFNHVSRNVIDAIAKFPNITWYNVLVMQGNRTCLSERKLRG